MNRRTLLSVCAGTALGGCLGIVQHPQSRISWIRLKNERDEAYVVEVLIEEGDEQVFGERHQLGINSGSENIQIDNPVDGLGDYVVRFRADEQWVDVDPSESIDGDGNILGIRFSLHAEGTLEYSVESI